MKFSILLVATPLLALASATRLCDKLIAIKGNIDTLTTSLSSNITDQNTLFVAYRNLHSATQSLDGLNSELTTTTDAINGASSTLADLDIKTACWIGWLVNLESGLQQVSQYLGQINSRGAQDLMNGNVKNVQGYGSQIHSQAQTAATKLDQANQALATLNQYNDNVLCW